MTRAGPAPQAVAAGLNEDGRAGARLAPHRVLCKARERAALLMRAQARGQKLASLPPLKDPLRDLAIALGIRRKLHRLCADLHKVSREPVDITTSAQQRIDATSV